MNNIFKAIIVIMVSKVIKDILKAMKTIKVTNVIICTTFDSVVVVSLVETAVERATDVDEEALALPLALVATAAIIRQLCTCNRCN